MRLRPALAKVSTLAAALLLAALMLEGGVRVLAPQQLIELRPDIWIADHEGFGWRQREGLDTTVNTGERTVRLVTGSHGHRIAGSPRDEPGVRVLALGDSFTVGLQVEYEDLFTARLERQLGERIGRTVDVVNTGVGGWGPSHYRLEAERELASGRFDAVLLGLFAGNDIEERRVDSFPPKQASVVHSFHWPQPWSRRGLVEAVAYPANDLLERRSHAFVLARAVAWRQLMRVGLSARALPPAVLATEAASPRWEVTADLVAAMVDHARLTGVPVLVCLIPGAYQVDPSLALAYARAIGVDPGLIDTEQPSRLLGAALAARGITLVDLLGPMRKSSAGPLFGSVDTHLSPAGHGVVADSLEAPLAAALDQSP